MAISNGRPSVEACRDAGIVEQTYDRWRSEFGGLKMDQAKRLKDLEKENLRLRRLVTELSQEKQVLKDEARPAPVGASDTALRHIRTNLVPLRSYAAEDRRYRQPVLQT